MFTIWLIAREEEDDEISAQLQNDLGSLREDIDYEKSVREDDAEKVIKTLSEEISRNFLIFLKNSFSSSIIGQNVGNFHLILQDEIEARNKNYDLIMKEIDDVQNSLLQEIDNERLDREETEESMIKVLEDVGLSCN